MALTRAQIQTAFQNSLGRAASQSDENSFFAVSQSGALTDAQIFSTISNSREADQIADPVIRFYQAAFGRVPDQAGLANAEAYVRAFTPTAATYQNLSNMFAQSTEFTNRFGTGTAVDAAYVQALYSTILGRSATSAEVDGYVSGAAGYTTRGGVLYAVSQSSEAISVSDAAVNGFQLNAAQGTAVYSGTLYTAANGQPNTPGSNGLNLVFTTNIDTLNGGAGNDTFTGDAATITAADSVNGGAGTDTVNLVGVATASTLPTLTNVERLVFTTPANAVARDVSGIAGLQEVVVTATPTGTDITTAAGVKTTLGATGTIAAASVTTAASATAETVGLAGGTFTALNVNGAAVTNLTLDASANTTITTLQGTAGATANANSTLTITGASKLTVTNALDVDFTTVNASANTGGVTLTFGANNVTATGGAGNDKFVFGANLTTADTVVGGAGTDTVTVAGADYSTVVANGTLAALNSKVTGVEVLEFTGGDAGGNIISGTTFSNTEVTKILFNTTTGLDTVNAAGSARTYAVGELNTGALTLNGTAGVTSFNVSLEGITGNGGNVDAVTAAFTNNTASQVGTGTINLASIGTNDAANVNSTGVITATSNGAAITSTNVVVTGSHDLTIGGLGTSGTINASAFTGKLIATGSAGQDTITGGSGADTINASTGGDTYTGGAGNDTFTFTNVNQATSSALTTITDFTSGADKLNVAAIKNGTPVVGATAVNVSAAPDFQGALNIAAAGDGATNSAVNYFQFSGNTYVVVDNTAGATFAATDAVIKLTGLVSPVAADFITA